MCSRHEGRESRVYPKASYSWRLYKSEYLRMPWSNVKSRLRELKRLRKLPVRFHTKSSWWWIKYWMKRYCELLQVSDQDGPFRVGNVKGIGLGIFANTRMKKGSLLTFGS
jgi:hypothetical protein